MIRSRMYPLALVLALAVIAGAITALAAPMTPYSKPSFVAAQSADKPIVVFVHATW